MTSYIHLLFHSFQKVPAAVLCSQIFQSKYLPFRAYIMNFKGGRQSPVDKFSIIAFHNKLIESNGAALENYANSMYKLIYSFKRY